MQQRKIVEDYLDSVIPQKISESTKKRLRAEIECHTYDRADFYMEIGYDEDAAFEKAIEQMGEGEEVKVEFESLYIDSGPKALLLFFAILFTDLLAAISGFGGAMFWMFDGEMLMYLSFESLVISSCFICFSLLVIVYAYRNNQRKKLVAMGMANLIMSVMQIFMNSLYYPFAYLIAQSIGIYDSFYSDLDFFLSEFISVPMCILCFALLCKLKKRNGGKLSVKISFSKLSFVTIVFFALIITVCYYICNTPYSEYFNYSGVGYMIQEHIIEPLEKGKNAELFDSITGDTDFSKAQELLEKEGFVPHTDIEAYVKDEDSLRAQIDYIKQLLKFDDEVVYVKPYADGYVSFFGEYIAVSPSENGKVKYKKLVLEAEGSEKEKTEDAKESFEKLRFGDDEQTVLKTMKKVAVISSYSVDYGENTTIESYEFNAFKNLSFLSSIDNTYFCAVVVFENGLLKGGEYTYTTETNFETDDVVYDKTKYVISE